MVTICGLTATNNRRQGMSVVGVDGLVVSESVFEHTNGTAPQAGIDVEPDAGKRTHNVRVQNCTMRDNAGSGFFVWGSSGDLQNVTVQNLMVERSGQHGIRLVNARGEIIIEDNTIINAQFGGINLYGVDDAYVSQNIIDDVSLDHPYWHVALFVELGSRNHVVANQVDSPDALGIFVRGESHDGSETAPTIGNEFIANNVCVGTEWARVKDQGEATILEGNSFCDIQ